MSAHRDVTQMDRNVLQNFRTCVTGAMLAAIAALPAVAQTVVDGSDRTIPADVRARIFEIVRAQGGPKAELRDLRPAQTAGSIIYCGRVRIAGTSFVPLLVNVTAGIAYALTDNLTGREREFRKARLAVYRCL
jgi:hypothetical protein